MLVAVLEFAKEIRGSLVVLSVPRQHDVRSISDLGSTIRYSNEAVLKRKVVGARALVSIAKLYACS